MITIILPTYNEKENIIDLVEALFNHIKQPFEIIVVDDDSPDMTWKIVEDYNNPRVKVIRRTQERGLSTAIDKGLKEAKGDVVGWMDADMGMPPSALPQMLAALDGCDIAIGSRYVSGGYDARGFFRVMTSKAVNWFAGLFLGFDIKDYDSGFVVLKKYVFDKVVFPAKGYGDYFVEFIYRCKKKGFKIEEVPYTFEDRKRGKSKTAATPIGFIKLGFGYLVRIIRVRFSKLR